MRRSQTRSQCPAALNAAARCCNRRAECHARSTRARPTSSAAASHTKPAPCCPQRGSPMLLSSGATHAQHKCDSHGVHHPNKRSGRHAALSTASPCCCRRVPCTLRTSATHIKGGSPTREAGAQLLAALQPNAAVSALSVMHAQHERTHAQHERDSHQVRQTHTRSRRPAALSAAATAQVTAECNTTGIQHANRRRL